jgi:hypothetical protein
MYPGFSSRIREEMRVLRLRASLHCGVMVLSSGFEFMA